MAKWLISRREYRASLVLFLAIWVVLLGNLLLEKYEVWKPESSLPFATHNLDSLLALLEVEKRADYKADSSRKPWENKKEESKPLHLSPFDPNTVSREEWLAMNLPEKVFNGLEKYRMKGGRIRKPEQVLKLYNLKPEIAEAMLPFVRLDTASLKAGNRFASKPFPKFEAKEKPKPFDLNLADTTQLMTVFGIGRGLSNRIVRHRNGLGGFLKKDQVYEVFGLDSSVVEELFLKSYIPANPEITKLAINTLSEEELAKNPYIRKGFARIIVKYRTQHGDYHKPEDLLEIKIIKPDLVEKLRPYLTF